MYHVSNIFYPKLQRPNTGGFSSHIEPQRLMRYAPLMQTDINPDQPRRKSMIAPHDNNSFVKPIKQSFVKNPRLSPMCRLMLTLISGWAGQGGSIETTIGTLGKHLSRCRRQIHRYLQDAVEEGYLRYSRRKDRIGRYIGIKIYLNFEAIRFTSFAKTKPDQAPVKAAGIIDVTLKSEINTKDILTKEKATDDLELWERLSQLAVTAGFLDSKPSLE